MSDTVRQPTATRVEPGYLDTEGLRRGDMSAAIMGFEQLSQAKRDGIEQTFRDHPELRIGVFKHAATRHQLTDAEQTEIYESAHSRLGLDAREVVPFYELMIETGMWFRSLVAESGLREALAASISLEDLWNRLHGADG